MNKDILKSWCFKITKALLVLGAIYLVYLLALCFGFLVQFEVFGVQFKL